MKEFLDEPVTYSNAISMMAGWLLGRALFSYVEYKRFKKAMEEYMADNMKQAGYRD